MVVGGGPENLILSYPANAPHHQGFTELYGRFRDKIKEKKKKSLLHFDSMKIEYSIPTREMPSSLAPRKELPSSSPPQTKNSSTQDLISFSFP